MMNFATNQNPWNKISDVVYYQSHSGTMLAYFAKSIKATKQTVMLHVITVIVKNAVV